MRIRTKAFFIINLDLYLIEGILITYEIQNPEIL